MDLPSRLSFCVGNRHRRYISRLDGPFRCDVLAGMTSSGDEVVLSYYHRCFRFAVRTVTVDALPPPDTHRLSCGRVLERHDDELLLKWTENQVRAYQLLRVFLYEPGGN